jgi:hypothetical protein
MNGLRHWKSHFPLVHTGAACAGAVHTTLHVPQLEVSLPVSTHDAPQVVLLPQSALQVPALHTVPEPHSLPQAPQFFESEL